MRQIGTLPKHLDPRAFADHLLTLGMKTRIDERPAGWDLWIYNEDHFGRAREELQGYLGNPENPRYREATQAAQAIRRREQQLDKQFRKNYREVSDQWAYPNFRRRPLTTILFALCVVVFIWQQAPSGRALEMRLFLAPYSRDALGHYHDDGLGPILHGEVWRLVTPIFMHGSLLHLFFNMGCLNYFGTMIEVRRGTLRLAGLVLVSAVLSNLGQYLWMERTDPGGIHVFLGISGVGCALFGYIWMKGLHEPEQGMILHPNSITMMLLFLVICTTGAIPSIANAAHFVGLAVGIVFGVLRY
ncbi:MAG TPA: rhomboid family intramembrane serine protease [Isosphaeraceae bacterium]|nr:rhomboid family intramembrane serine protease [Isosphaeraceae bacterium]